MYISVCVWIIEKYYRKHLRTFVSTPSPIVSPLPAVNNHLERKFSGGKIGYPSHKKKGEKVSPLNRRQKSARVRVGTRVFHY